MTGVRAPAGVVRFGTWLLAAAGVVVATLLVRRFGGDALVTHLAALGPAVPPILIITGLRYPLQAAGWRLALRPAERPPWPQAIGATLAGNSLSYLTFAGPVAGEPARALLLRGHTSMARGIAAGAVERSLYALTASLVMALGFAAAASRLGHARQVSGVVMVAAVVIAAIVLARRLRPQTAVERSARRPAAWRDTARDLWRSRPADLAGIVLVDLGQHVLLLAEAWVILRALGAPAAPTTVLIFESMTKATNSLGTFVPGGAGVSEAGSALLSAGLGMGAELGLALALVRRGRALLWAMIGLAMLGISDVPLSLQTGGAGAARAQSDASAGIVRA